MERLIVQADSLIAAYCGWPVNNDGIRTLESSDYTRYPLPRHDEPRALDHGLIEVSAVNDVFVDDLWEYGAGTEITNAAYLKIDNDERVIWLTPSAPHAWSAAARANKLTLTAGFVATPSGGYSTAPADLVAIVAAEVRHLWDLRQTQGTISTNKGEHSTQRDAADQAHLLPKAVRALLGPYIRWSSRAS